MFIKTFLLLTTISYTYASHIPPIKTDDTQLVTQVRVFKPLKNNQLFVFEFTRSGEDGRALYTFDLSLRRKVSRHVDYGFESSYEINHRKDDDWRLSDGNWQWKDKNKDVTSSLFLKLKKDLYIMDKVFVVTSRFKTINNWTQTLLTLVPEVSLTYMHFSAGIHKFNLFAKSYIYIPLNYSTEDIYKKAIYTGFLYNYSNKVQPYIYVERQRTYWTPSKDFKEVHTNLKYKQTHDNTNIGIGINYHL